MSEVNESQRLGDTIPTEAWTDGMRCVEKFTKKLASELLYMRMEVAFIHSDDEWKAKYTDCCINFNLSSLGQDWFEELYSNIDELLAMLLLEFTNYIFPFTSSDDFTAILLDMSVAMANLAVKDRRIFWVY